MKQKRLDAWQTISFVILGLYALFLVLPMFSLLRNAVVGPDGEFTLSYFQEFFSKKSYYGTLLNSFQVSVAVTAASLVLGTLFAYFYCLFEIKSKAFLQTLSILCCMSPPVIGAYSWIQMFGRAGIVTKALRSLLGMRVPDI